MINNNSSLKNPRRLLALNAPEPVKDDLHSSEYKAFGNAILALLGMIGPWIIVGLIALFVSCQAVHASEYTDEQIVNAIYKAEGGAKTRHPYGILAKYKTTTPRQACFNTVRNKRKQWVRAGKPGKFLAFLASKYAPIGALNDPTNLNSHWLRNVEKILRSNA